MDRRHFVGGAALSVGLGAVGARAQKEPDTLRVAWRDAIPNVDFYYNPLRTSLVVSHHVWDTLIYRDPETFQLKPQLALSWRVIDDTTLDFALRPNVLFHDGSRFSADDVLYTVDLVMSDAKLAVPTNYAFLAGAEKTDELTVRFKLRRVFPGALEYVAMVLPIYPKLYRERVGADFSNHPVGTGPYRVRDVDGVGGLTLERNESFFEGPKGRPSIKIVAIGAVADATSELSALLNGQADWIWNVSADQMPRLNAMPALQTMTSESMRLAYLTMDAAGRTFADNPMTQPKVREAIARSIDRGTMSRQFMPGGSRVLDAPCFPTQFGCDAGVATKYEYDPATARALLADAGFKDGFDTEIVSYLLPQWAQAVQGYLSAVGIRARATMLPVDTVVQRSAEGKNPIEMGSWGSYSINDVSAFLPYFFDGGVHDDTRDPEVTNLVEEAGSTTDPDKRRADYSGAIRLITSRAEFLPLFTYVTTYALSRQLNFRPFRDELPRFYLASWR